MNTSPPYRPVLPDPRRPARRAGWLMIALGVFAVGFAGLALLFAKLWPTLRGQPGMEDAVQQIERLNIDVVHYFYLTAAMLALYAVLSIVLGISVRDGRRRPVRTAMFFAGAVLLISGLNLIAGLSGGVVAAVFGMLIVAAHGLLFNWLWQANQQAPAVEHFAERATPATAALPRGPAPLAAEPAAPMAAYYAPLPPPPRPNTSHS